MSRDLNALIFMSITSSTTVHVTCSQCHCTISSSVQSFYQNRQVTSHHLPNLILFCSCSCLNKSSFMFISYLPFDQQVVEFCNEYELYDPSERSHYEGYLDRKMAKFLDHPKKKWVVRAVLSDFQLELTMYQHLMFLKEGKEREMVIHSFKSIVLSRESKKEE